MIAPLLLASALAQLNTPLPPAETSITAESSCSKPVYMVVAGKTHDRARMQAYAKAIAESKLYEKLGGYYVNAPFANATLEGDVPESHVTLIVRFPCLSNAKAFWYSREYQEDIKPIRTTPPIAGDYIVTVYPEVPLRSDLSGKVGDNGYSAKFDAAAVEQVPQ